MIDSCSLGDKPYETLYRISRYYLDENYTKAQTRKMLDTFLLQCDPKVSLPSWSDLADRALNKALKNQTILLDYISITKPEMDVVDALSGTQLKRLAFALLCLAKFGSLAYGSDYWVNNKDSEIMRMANVNTSIKRQSLMYYTLNNLGLIRFSKKIDNTNVRINFIKEGEEVLRITDFRNLGYQYLKYHGEPYYECQNCGLTVKMKETIAGRKPKYCTECAMEIHMRQKINSMMRVKRPIKTENTIVGVDKNSNSKSFSPSGLDST